MLSSVRGLRRKRIVLLCFALLVLYLFIKHLPTDLKPIGDRIDQYGRLREQPPIIDHNGPSPNIPGVGGSEQEGYNGPLRFQKLGESLTQSIYRIRTKPDVLFAVSRLQSATRLIPLACDMAKHNRTHVHFAFLGRQSLIPARLLSTLGIAQDDCPMYWIDGRPDHELVSSQKRIKLSIISAMTHIQRSLRLNMVLALEDELEDPLFTASLREVAPSVGISVVRLPTATDSMSWIASLDPLTLKYLPNIEIDIVIRAERDFSGPLMRLLRSLQRAQYNGLRPPRLIVEIPSHIDATTRDFVRNFNWPGQMLIRRRLIDNGETQTDVASIMESFYPAHPPSTHVLLLSTTAEVAPGYFQYLIYMLLAYGYEGADFSTVTNLFGIALDLPAVQNSNGPLVLHQTPSEGAALYFGDKWVRLHEFVSHKMSEKHSEHDGNAEMPSRGSSWREDAELYMKAENLFLMYPKFGHDLPIAILHQHTNDQPTSAQASSLSTTNILAIVSAFTDAVVDGHVPTFWEIPLLSADGQSMTWQTSRQQATQFAGNFSLTVGGCADLKDRNPSKLGTPGYLFCTPDR